MQAIVRTLGRRLAGAGRLPFAAILAALACGAASPQVLDSGAGAAADAAAQAALQTVAPTDPTIDDREAAIARAGALINDLRRRLDDCGVHGIPGAGPMNTGIPDRPALRANPRLAEAAQGHAIAMATRGFFAHADPEGRTVGRRVTSVGYRWQRVGENLAAGHRSVDEAVQGWLRSRSHCEVMLDARFTEFGLARAVSRDPADPYGVYWTLVLGQP